MSLKPIIKLNVANVPPIYQKRVHCNFDGNYVTTTIEGISSYGCSVSSNTGGYKMIGMKYKKINAIKLNNVHNTFLNKITLTYVKNGDKKLRTDYYLKLIYNTQNLINNGELKADCSDFLIGYKGNQIGRKVTGCGGTETSFEFNVQKSEKGTVNGYEAYYGNPDAVAQTAPADTTTYSITPTEVGVTEEVLTLNSNLLSFGFLKLFSVSTIDPVGSLVTNSTVKISNTYVDVNYNGLIRFETRYDSSRFDASFISSKFESNIYSVAGKPITISIWAVYIPTQQSIQGSSNSVNFIFMDRVQTNYLYPFVDRYSGSNTKKTPTVKITTNSNLLTAVGLKCRYTHNGITKFSIGTFSGGSSHVQCPIDVTLNQNTELVTFELYMDVSTNQALNFILSSNNLTYVFLKEPIQVLIPSTITTHYFNQNFTLDFSNPQLMASTNISYDNYKLKMIPEYSNTNPSKYLSCQFNLLKPECMIQDLSLTHTPMRLDYMLEIRSPHFVDIVNFTTTSNIFKSNVTFFTELPYVGDAITHQSSPFVVEFNISKKLHPDYNFYCEIYSKRIPIVRNVANEGIFTCSFNSHGYEEVVPISLHINNTSVSGLDGIISFEDTTVQMVVLEFSPEFVTFPEVKTLSIRKNNSATFSVPTIYRSVNHRIDSTDNNEFGCTISAAAGSISCSKTNIPTQSLVDI